jgi:hypothetical protein
VKLLQDSVTGKKTAISKETFQEVLIDLLGGKMLKIRENARGNIDLESVGLSNPITIRPRSANVIEIVIRKGF